MQRDSSKKTTTFKSIIVIVIMVGVYFLVNILIGIYLKKYALAYFGDDIEEVYYITQITLTFFVAGSAIFGVRQFYIYCKCEKDNSNKNAIGNTVDMAMFYKEKIINKYRPLRYVYDRTGILPILENKRSSEMIKFNMHEFKRLFTKLENDSLKKIQNSSEFIEAIVEANTIYGFNPKIKKHMDSKIILAAFAGNVLYELLNDMEVFALRCLHQSIYEDITYSCLHQTFLEIVPVLYYNIAKENNDSEQKYYEHIIELYLKWSEK